MANRSIKYLCDIFSVNNALFGRNQAQSSVILVWWKNLSHAECVAFQIYCDEISFETFETAGIVNLPKQRKQKVSI